MTVAATLLFLWALLGASAGALGSEEAAPRGGSVEGAAPETAPPPALDATVEAAKRAAKVTRRAPEPASPWSLNLSQDERGASVGMSYRLRWDGDDFLRSPSAVLDKLRNPFRSADWTMRDLAEATRVDLYGLRVRPFRGLFADPRAYAPAGGAGGSGEASAPLSGSERRKRWLAAELDELRRNAKSDARRWMIRTAFNEALPNASQAPQWQKEAVAGGLLDVSRSWGSELVE